MRIIGGEFRSRRLFTPKDDSVTRPIPDRVKESLFGMLRGHCEGASVLDAFAGTGALGLEALSRGAARCVFVERSRDIAAILQQNIDALAAADRSEVVIGDALGPGALARAPRPVNLAFFDPPYPLVRDSAGWNRVRTQFERVVALLAPDGFAVLRTPWPFLLDAPPDSLGAPEREPERPRRGRTRRTERHSDEEWTTDAHTIKKWSEAAPPETDADSDGSDASDTESAAAAPPPRAAGDLQVPRANGPETHVYGSTALHLYMRRPAPSPPAP